MEEFLDSEIGQIGKVLDALHQKQGSTQNLEAFRQEIIGRFAEIGLIAEVKTYTVADRATGVEIPDTFGFDIVDLTWIDKKPFDFDQQVYEVTNDILEILPPSERGVIKAKPGDFQKPHKH
jgi:hypothetical protein